MFIGSRWRQVVGLTLIGGGLRDVDTNITLVVYSVPEPGWTKVMAIVVPLNVLFGVPAALLLARNHFRGKGVLQSIVDLPFAVSPIIVGVALISAWGSAGALGFIERDTGVRIIFGVPGIVLASIFVTLPFVVREVKLVLTRGPSRSKRRRRWVRVGGRRSCASPCRRSGGAWPTAWC